ncbi:MAG: hypothetical protein HY719_17820 [Planctomycetes bacterium]|nr:hypothetical protein [Planctomycetota bacterium]
MEAFRERLEIGWEEALDSEKGTREGVMDEFADAIDIRLSRIPADSPERPYLQQLRGDIFRFPKLPPLPGEEAAESAPPPALPTTLVERPTAAAGMMPSPDLVPAPDASKQGHPPSSAPLAAPPTPSPPAERAIDRGDGDNPPPALPSPATRPASNKQPPSGGQATGRDPDSATPGRIGWLLAVGAGALLALTAAVIAVGARLHRKA